MRLSVTMMFTALLAAPALTMAGCGSSSSRGNGVAAKAPQDILAASRTAAQTASSVHVVSESGTGPLKLRLDLHLSRNGGYGKIAILGTSFELRRAGHTLYLRGSPRFYQRLGITTHIPAGSWVAIPADMPQVSQLASFTSPSKETGLLLTSNDAVSKGATSTLEGQPVIELKPSGRLYTASLYIATTGQPYPLKLEKHGRLTATTTFSAWNDAVTVTPPVNTIRVGRFQQEGRSR
jgi:hypothetical protein